MASKRQNQVNHSSGNTSDAGSASQENALFNADVYPEDAREPEGNADRSFDPGELEHEPSTLPIASPDPFDPAALRLTQDFGAGLGIKKALLSIPVRKPANSWWVRVHPSNSYRMETFVIELKEDREIYLVARELWTDLATEATFSPRALFTAINRQGVLFIWPVRLPGPDGKTDEWSRTALEAADMAAKGWVRLAANMSLGAYDVLQAGGQLGEPVWPQEPLADLLRIGFRDRYINTLDHPVVRRLRGEV
jgi:hypothetical protein